MAWRNPRQYPYRDQLRSQNSNRSAEDRPSRTTTDPAEGVPEGREASFWVGGQSRWESIAQERQRGTQGMESATNVGRQPQNTAEYLPTHGLTADLSLACDDLSRRIQQTSARTAAEQNAAMPPPSQIADPESLKYIYTMRSVMKLVDSTIDDIQLRWGVARTFFDRGSLSSRGDGGFCSARVTARLKQTHPQSRELGLVQRMRRM